jgi:two-component system, NarL family, invasion response regulator UvrY
MANIVLTDDHVLLRNGLAGLIKNLGHHVLFEADNGKDLIDKLKPGNLPDIVLMDINMPEMDGWEATLWLQREYPKIKVIALSMYNNESAIIRMLKAGAKGYILKDTRPQDLKQAIEAVMNHGFHYSELLNGKLIQAINQIGDTGTDLNSLVHLQEKEIEILKHCCTEFTYKEIADKLGLSPRTIDSYRDGLFAKLNVKTRVGLVMFAIKNKIVQV